VPTHWITKGQSRAYTAPRYCCVDDITCDRRFCLCQQGSHRDLPRNQRTQCNDGQISRRGERGYPDHHGRNNRALESSPSLLFRRPPLILHLPPALHLGHLAPVQRGHVVGNLLRVTGGMEEFVLVLLQNACPTLDVGGRLLRVVGDAVSAASSTLASSARASSRA